MAGAIPMSSGVSASFLAVGWHCVPRSLLWFSTKAGATFCTATPMNRLVAKRGGSSRVYPQRTMKRDVTMHISLQGVVEAEGAIVLLGIDVHSIAYPL